MFVIGAHCEASRTQKAFDFLKFGRVWLLACSGEFSRHFMDIIKKLKKSGMMKSLSDERALS